MSKLKRGAAAALAAAMGAGLLAGCGSSSGGTTSAASGSTTTTAASGSATTTKAASGSSSSGDTNMVFAWWGNQTRNERTSNAITKYQEQNPGVKIEGQFSEWNDYWQKLATNSAGNALPDIIQMDYQYLNQYMNTGLLYDLTEFTKDGTIDTSKWNQNMINAGTMNGKLVAVCAGINAPALVYDKAITDKAGVTIKDNMSIDEFIEASKKIYETTGYKTNIQYGTAQEIFSYWSRADGSILFNTGKVDAKPENLAKYFKIYEDGEKDGWMLSPTVFAEITIGSVEQDPLVYGDNPENQSWCTFCWSNQYVAVLKAAKEGQDIQMTTWPSADPKKSDFLKPSQFFSVSASAKNPKAAAAFINWLTNSEDANNILLGERGIPMNSDIASKVSAQLSENDQKTYTFVNDVVAKNCSDINPPYPDGYTEAGKALNTILEAVCYGQETAEQAGQDLVDQGTAALAAKAAASK